MTKVIWFGSISDTRIRLNSVTAFDKRPFLQCWAMAEVHEAASASKERLGFKLSELPKELRRRRRSVESAAAGDWRRGGGLKAGMLICFELQLKAVAKNKIPLINFIFLFIGN